MLSVSFSLSPSPPLASLTSTVLTLSIFVTPVRHFCCPYSLLSYLFSIVHVAQLCSILYSRHSLIGASLSEPHTYVKYATAVCMCIYIYIYMYICIYVPYVVLGHGTNLCRVQNGQDGRPLRSRCVRLKYSLRTASNEKEVVRNEAYAPTSQPGKNTGIVRRNSAN